MDPLLIEWLDGGIDQLRREAEAAETRASSLVEECQNWMERAANARKRYDAALTLQSSLQATRAD